MLGITTLAGSFDRRSTSSLASAVPAIPPTAVRARAEVVIVQTDFMLPPQKDGGGVRMPRHGAGGTARACRQIPRNVVWHRRVPPAAAGILHGDRRIRTGK